MLLADDHPAVLALTAAALAGECFVVGSVGDERALLAEAERLHPDVIVLDIIMPDLDGIEAARQLKRAGCRAKLVFLTVHEDPDYVRTALHAGGAPPTSSRRAWPPTSSRPSTKPSENNRFALANNFLGRKPIKPKWLSENKTAKR